MLCFLTVYNQLTWPRAMAAECVRLGLTPILVDNASTYQPLLDWYADKAACPYEVLRRDVNGSCYGFFRAGWHYRINEPFILSDSDLDLSGVPTDCVEHMRYLMDEHPEVTKVGLSLEINDLPDHNVFKPNVVKHESRYWLDGYRLISPKDGVPAVYRAGVGATFAMYYPSRRDKIDKDFYNALRMERPYTARHLPWYLDLTPGKLSEELEYYYRSCDNIAHWGHQYRDHLKRLETQ